LHQYKTTEKETQETLLILRPRLFCSKVSRRKHPIVTVDALFSFFFFLFHFPTEICTRYFSLKTSVVDRNFKTMHRIVYFYFAIQHFWKLTNGQNTTSLRNFGTTLSFVKDIKPLCYDGKSISRRQGVTLTQCSEAVCAMPLRALQRAPHQLTPISMPISMTPTQRLLITM